MKIPTWSAFEEISKTPLSKLVDFVKKKITFFFEVIDMVLVKIKNGLSLHLQFVCLSVTSIFGLSKGTEV